MKRQASEKEEEAKNEFKKSKEKVMKSSIFNKMIVSGIHYGNGFCNEYISIWCRRKEAIVLFTNDVHCAIEGYSKLAAYKAQLEGIWK